MYKGIYTSSYNSFFRSSTRLHMAMKHRHIHVHVLRNKRVWNRIEIRKRHMCYNLHLISTVHLRLLSTISIIYKIVFTCRNGGSKQPNCVFLCQGQPASHISTSQYWVPSTQEAVKKVNIITVMYNIHHTTKKVQKSNNTFMYSVLNECLHGL